MNPTQARRPSGPTLGSLFSVAALSGCLFVYTLLLHACSPPRASWNDACLFCCPRKILQWLSSLKDEICNVWGLLY